VLAIHFLVVEKERGYVSRNEALYIAGRGFIRARDVNRGKQIRLHLGIVLDYGLWKLITVNIVEGVWFGFQVVAAWIKESESTCGQGSYEGAGEQQLEDTRLTFGPRLNLRRRPAKRDGTSIRSFGVVLLDVLHTNQKTIKAFHMASYSTDLMPQLSSFLCGRFQTAESGALLVLEPGTIR